MMNEAFTEGKRIVIKIGSSIITDEKNVIDETFMNSLADQVKRLRQKKGVEAIIVSSGAVAAGMMVLGLREKPRNVSEKQAVAACGQGYLIHKYSESFSKRGIIVAQVLLTAEDMADRKRYLNARNTLEALLAKKIVPIINENDTVATTEIKMGDNDNLSAEVTCLLGADGLIMLSDVDGLYDSDPQSNPNARRHDVVTDAGRFLKKASNKAGSNVGTGGIYTKLQAARKTMLMGIPAVLARGKEKDVIQKIMDGRSVGTLFTPREKKISRRKYFIAFNVKPKGRIVVDDGAADAILKRGTSLLPSGILKVSGSFRVGDVVEIVTQKGDAVARGLSNYSLVEVEKIRGRKTAEIEKLLGYRSDDEVIHRNNMALVRNER